MGGGGAHRAGAQRTDTAQLALTPQELKEGPQVCETRIPKEEGWSAGAGALHKEDGSRSEEKSKPTSQRWLLKLMPLPGRRADAEPA